MSGDYRSKKEVAHLLVPSVGRKVIDLGGNLEKGAQFIDLYGNMELISCLRSANYEVDWQFLDYGCHRDHVGEFDTWREGGNRL